MNAYAEFTDLIAAGITPEQILAFKASDEMRNRFYELLAKEKQVWQQKAIQTN